MKFKNKKKRKKEKEVNRNKHNISIGNFLIEIFLELDSRGWKGVDWIGRPSKEN